MKMPIGDIEKFVESRADWIAEKTAQQRERNAASEAFSLNYYSTLSYRGKEYPLEAKSGKRCGFDNTRFFMPPGLSTEQIRSAAEQIYRMLAKREIPAKVSEFAKRMGVEPIAVKISGARTRWGSCSDKGSLNFSWRLMMAEDSVIDYIVVHELAHITEMNHSERFWKIVGKILPDYRASIVKLKQLQRKLKIEKWE
jgi:predicted metal-dependent hydrolase